MTISSLHVRSLASPPWCAARPKPPPSGVASRSWRTLPSRKNVGGQRPTKIASRSARALASRSDRATERPQKGEGSANGGKPEAVHRAGKAELAQQECDSHRCSFRLTKAEAERRHLAADARRSAQDTSLLATIEADGTPRLPIEALARQVELGGARGRGLASSASLYAGADVRVEAA